MGQFCLEIPDGYGPLNAINKGAEKDLIKHENCNFLTLLKGYISTIMAACSASENLKWTLNIPQIDTNMNLRRPEICKFTTMDKTRESLKDGWPGNINGHERECL